MEAGGGQPWSLGPMLGEAAAHESESESDDDYDDDHDDDDDMGIDASFVFAGASSDTGSSDIGFSSDGPSQDDAIVQLPPPPPQMPSIELQASDAGAGLASAADSVTAATMAGSAASGAAAPQLHPPFAASMEALAGARSAAPPRSLQDRGAAVGPAAKRARSAVNPRRELDGSAPTPALAPARAPAPAPVAALVPAPHAWSRATVERAEALSWLQDPAITCAGARPERMLALDHIDGLIFKEQVSTRRRTPLQDKWSPASGKKGRSIEQMAPGLWVRKTYGAVTLRNETGGAVTKRKYHEYTMHTSDPAETSGGAKARADPPAYRLYHVLFAAPSLTADAETRHQGLMRIQHKSPKDTRFLQFENSSGQTLGAIELNEDKSGVVLRSTTGDMAEWHPRLPFEPPFSEGDVVG